MRAGCYVGTAVALAVAACLPAFSHGLGAGAAAMGPAAPLGSLGRAGVASTHGGLKLRQMRGGSGGPGVASQHPFEFDMVANNLREMWAQPALFGEENGSAPFHPIPFASRLPCRIFY